MSHQSDHRQNDHAHGATHGCALGTDASQAHSPVSQVRNSPPTPSAGAPPGHPPAGKGAAGAASPPRPADSDFAAATTRPTSFWRCQPLTWARARDYAAVLLLALAAFALMHPIWGDPHRREIGWPGDNIQYTYAIGWMGQALVSGQSPFIDPRINPPEGLAVLGTDVPYLGFLAVQLFLQRYGAVFGYNVFILIVHFLCGFVTYLWIRRLTGSRWGALVAGLAFMMSPFRQAHSCGHPQLISMYPLVLLFWALDHTLSASRAAWGLGAVAGAAYLLGGASQYLLVIGAVCATVYVLLCAKLRPLATPARLPLAALAFLVGAFLGSLPSLMVGQSGVYRVHPLEEVRQWAASPINFLLPSHIHPLWGPLVGWLWPDRLWVERTLTLGFVPLALAVAGWRRNERRWIWAGTAAVAALLALGTDLHLGPEPLAQENPFWLPAYYLNQLPILRHVRAWSRFGGVTVLMVMLMAGMGAAEVVRRVAERRGVAAARCLGTGLVTLIFIEFLPMRLPSIVLEPRVVDCWLASKVSPGTIVAFTPIPNSVANFRVLYGTLTHQKRTYAFMHSVHRPAVYLEVQKLLERFPAPDAIEQLAENYRIDYVVIEKAYLDGKAAPRWEDLLESVRGRKDVTLETEFPDTAVFSIHTPRPTTVVQPFSKEELQQLRKTSQESSPPTTATDDETTPRR